MHCSFIVLLLSVFALSGCSHYYPDNFLGDLERTAATAKPLPAPAIRMSLTEMFPDNAQAQALVQTARRGEVKEIDRLIDAGADPNAVGAYGITVPGWVLFKPNKAGFRRLLERGADPNKIWYYGKYSQKSLMEMAVEDSPEIGVDYLRMCLEIGKGDPNLESPNKHRVIAEALRPQRAAAFAVLYKAGAQIDYPSDEFGGYSLVGSAASARNFKLTLFMLEHGVDYLRIGEEVKNRLQNSLQRTFKNGAWGGRLEDPERMWFWRCVDWLEKRGMVFDYTPAGDRKPLVRPAVLDTTPPDILGPEANK